MIAKLLRGHYFGAVTRCLEIGGLLLSETWHVPHARIPPHAHQQAYLCLVHKATTRNRMVTGPEPAGR